MAAEKRTGETQIGRVAAFGLAPEDVQIHLLGAPRVPLQQFQIGQTAETVIVDLRGRHVLLVDDILDSGSTLKTVIPLLQSQEPASLKTCVLLRKDRPAARSIEVDYVGFEIPDAFVVGYGLDFAERYRNLPFVGVLHPHIYKEACQQVCKNKEV